MFSQRSIPPLSFPDPPERVPSRQSLGATSTPPPAEEEWDLTCQRLAQRRLAQITTSARSGATTIPGMAAFATAPGIQAVRVSEPPQKEYPSSPPPETEGLGRGYVRSSSTVVHLEGVTKRFPNGNCVLNAVDLRVQQGEFVFITGVSGAGKSTLLRLLYGADQATAGRITVNDVRLNRIRPRPLALLRRQLGVVFQDYRLLANRTVNENVAFVLRAQGLSPAEIRRRLGPTLKMVGLVSKADRFPHELSGGEQQRLSLARAIVSTPVLLLADEPTGNLDRENSLLVLQILQRLNSFGVTIIMTTHDPYLWERNVHRMLRVEEGQLHEVR